MKVGIKKVHENEWQIHVSCASVKMDRFAIELLNISLDHLLALQSGQSHSILTSYIHLGSKLKELDHAGVQLLLREVDNQDIFKLLMVADDDELTVWVLKNVGGILAKQLQADMSRSLKPDLTQAKDAIRRVVEKMFELEAAGRIEFYNRDTQYI